MSRILAALVLLLASPAFAFHVTTQTRASKPTGNTDVTVTVDIGKNALADVLFVVDNSGSMGGHQANLTKNIAAITSALFLYDNINTAVITTDMGGYSTGPHAGMGQFVGPVLNSSQKDFIDPLSTQLKVGTDGSPDEKPLEAVSVALSEALLSGANKGFLRGTADLILVFITDAEDQGAVKPDALWSQLQVLKPNNSIKTIATTSFDLKTCMMDSNYSTETPIKDFIALSGGSLVDLCSDYAQSIPAVLGQLQTVETQFELQVFPGTEILTKSMVVKVGEDVLVAGDTKNGWTFDSSTNILTVGSEVFVKVKEPLLTISYTLVNK